MTSRVKRPGIPGLDTHFLYYSLLFYLSFIVFISKKETVHAPFYLTFQFHPIVFIHLINTDCAPAVPGSALRSEKFSGLRELGLMSSKQLRGKHTNI